MVIRQMWVIFHSLSDYFRTFAGQNVLSKQKNVILPNSCVKFDFLRPKTPSFTLNFQLVFANLVYMVSRASFKGMYVEILDFN